MGGSAAVELTVERYMYLRSLWQAQRRFGEVYQRVIDECNTPCRHCGTLNMLRHTFPAETMTRRLCGVCWREWKRCLEMA